MPLDLGAIAAELNGQFGETTAKVVENGPSAYLEIAGPRIADVCLYLKRNPNHAYAMLNCLSAVDNKDHFSVVYHLTAITHANTLQLKVLLDHADPHVPTVVPVWGAADWHEREAWDLVGVVFDGHPNLERILCREDWDGHPLQRDYVMPEDPLMPPRNYDFVSTTGFVNNIDPALNPVAAATSATATSAAATPATETAAPEQAPTSSESKEAAE